ncbi:MAG: LuxR family transcriptional [Geobacteraceae bacterium]|nr:MAG: LuxR family transcriptional [Geobacteraceae bacterium]
MGIKVLIADDHAIVREGMKSLLGKDSHIDVVAEANNGREAVQRAKEHLPDLVLMDMNMPEMNGFEATRRIITETPEARVLIYSVHADMRFVFEAMRAGAKGYLLGGCNAEELIHATRTCAANRLYISEEINAVIVKDYMRQSSESLYSPCSLLTSREREVLQLIAEGMNTKEIAFSLEVSIKTIETYRKQIMKKLKLRSVAELTKCAIREGLISMD